MKTWPYDYFGRQVYLSRNASRVLENSGAESHESFVAFVAAGGLAGQKNCGPATEQELAKLAGMYWVPKKEGHWTTPTPPPTFLSERSEDRKDRVRG